MIDTAEEGVQTEERVPDQRTIGCSIAYFGSLVEVGFSLADHSPKTSDVIQMAIGVITGCLLSALGAYAGDAAQVLLYPAIAAAVAGLADLMVSWKCTGRSISTVR